jgi:hypothetical protein
MAVVRRRTDSARDRRPAVSGVLSIITGGGKWVFVRKTLSQHEDRRRRRRSADQSSEPCQTTQFATIMVS